MAVINMSDVEKEVFKKDIEIALVKKWWPLVTFMFFFGLFIIRGTNWFDTNVATKTDVQELKAEIKDLKTTMISYAQTNEDVHIKLSGGIKVNRHSIDSLGSIVSVQNKPTHTKWVAEGKRPNGETYTYPVN